MSFLSAFGFGGGREAALPYAFLPFDADMMVPFLLRLLEDGTSPEAFSYSGVSSVEFDFVSTGRLAAAVSDRLKHLMRNAEERDDVGGVVFESLSILREAGADLDSFVKDAVAYVEMPPRLAVFKGGTRKVGFTPGAFSPALHHIIAATDGDPGLGPAAVAAACKAGCSPDAPDANGVRPLFLAAWMDDTGVWDALVEAGADVDAPPCRLTGRDSPKAGWSADVLSLIGENFGDIAGQCAEASRIMSGGADRVAARVAELAAARERESLLVTTGAGRGMTGRQVRL